MSGNDVVRMLVRIGDGQPKEIKGRSAHLPNILVDAPKGISTAELQAGLRVSDTVLELRRARVGIATETFSDMGDWRHLSGLVEDLLDAIANRTTTSDLRRPPLASNTKSSSYLGRRTRTAPSAHKTRIADLP